MSTEDMVSCCCCHTWKLFIRFAEAAWPDKSRKLQTNIVNFSDFGTELNMAMAIKLKVLFKGSLKVFKANNWNQLKKEEKAAEYMRPGNSRVSAPYEQTKTVAVKPYNLL